MSTIPNTGPEAAKAIRDLVGKCHMSLNLLYIKSGVAASTLMRWEGGSKPKSTTYMDMRRAALQHAAETGTLPDELRSEWDNMRRRDSRRAATPAVREKLADIERGLSELRTMLDQ